MSLSEKQTYLLDQAFLALCDARGVHWELDVENEPGLALSAAVHKRLMSGGMALTEAETAQVKPLIDEFHRLTAFEAGDDGEAFTAWVDRFSGGEELGGIVDAGEPLKAREMPF